MEPFTKQERLNSSNSFFIPCACLASFTHHDQEQEDEQHEAVHVVHLVVPKRGEDEVPAARARNLVI